MMLHDEHLVGAARRHIRDEKINAEWALRRTVDDISGVFDAIEDDYFRERRSDVEFVVERVLRNLLGARRRAGSRRRPTRSSSRTTCRRPTPRSCTARPSRRFVTDAGGKTSHTAIIARATRSRRSSASRTSPSSSGPATWCIVDGTGRLVIINPTPRRSRSTASEQRRQAPTGARAARATATCRRETTRRRARAAARQHRRSRGARRRARVRRRGHRPVPHRVPVHDGDRRCPTRSEHYQHALRRARAAARAGRRRSARSTSAATRSRAVRAGRRARPNPALGLRSIRLCLSPLGGTCSSRSCAACCARRRTARMRIMFPMISGCRELRAAKAVVEECKSELRARASPFDAKVQGRHHDRDAVGGAGRRPARAARSTSSRSARTTSSSTRWRSIA